MALRPNDPRKSQNKTGGSPQTPVSKQIIVLKLKSKNKNQIDKIFKFDKDRIVIGSVVSADVRLAGDGVAPIHAVLEINRNSKSNSSLSNSFMATLYDLASETGVFVNRKKIVAHQLSKEDEILIGVNHLVFSLEELDRFSGKDRVREAGNRTLFLNPNEDLTPLNLQDEREISEIFDYRPTSKRALEVVMSWCGVILDVEHFVKEKSVTVGTTRKSDFAIPASFSTTQYPIVTQRGGSFTLNLDAQMKGVIQRNGDLDNLDAVRATTIKGENGYGVPLGNNDFAKISIGDIDFYFSYTSAPPRLRRRRVFDRDPFFQKIFAISMALTLLFLFSLSKINLPVNIEPEQVPDRIAAILYQPEKFLNPPPVPVAKTKPRPVEPPKKVAVLPPPPPPKQIVKLNVSPKAPVEHKPLPKVIDIPKPVAKPVVSKPQVSKPQPVAANISTHHPIAPKASAKEGEGARAKGTEGSRGEKNRAKTATHVTQLSRPSPHTGNKGASGNSQISEEGNVDLLKGAGGRIQNILGNSAAHLGDGSEGLKGFGNFSTGGSGGLALSGSGQGGGGSAETTLGGLGKRGSGMGRVGTGKGAAGRGEGIVGSSVRVAIRSDGPEEAIVMGAIDRDAVAEAIYAHKDEFRLCYEREINAEHPTLSGQIGTSFVIGSSGRVTRAGIESSSLKNSNAERCVLTVLRRIEFPLPRGGGVVEVHFPFKFSAAGRS